ncbi:hypothetical protein MKY88_09385 [Lysinibacillus sp. FSL R7-0073]|uniref:hypothetical protein n=1 Tax=Lysinibacillus TaxID=400634 RepID=UPI002E1FC468|nr:hypothetical protein [Lysinibacillus fusiformis]
MLDKTIFVGNSGLASNKNGIQWLRQFVKNFVYTVIEIPLISIGNQLGQRGITVEYIDFTISRSFGASFRCSTQPLVREDLS